MKIKFSLKMMCYVSSDDVFTTQCNSLFTSLRFHQPRSQGLDQDPGNEVEISCVVNKSLSNWTLTFCSVKGMPVTCKM